MLRVDPRDKARLIDPLFTSGPFFRGAVIALSVIIGFGGVMYVRQLTLGLAETGLQRPVYWGVYMVNFIFLIGVSMAGTLISAALHLTGANWRRPITRIAETVTVFGLLIAGLQIMFDMGRPDRLLVMFAYGRLQSPLLWDVISLSTYILASMVALYISLIPDLAILRDNYPARGPAWRKKLYTRLALGWRGSRGQWFRLERAIRVISIIIIPIGISLHTVTAWILATTVQPGWHSTIMGPYFVVGAVFSGIGLLFILITLVRRMLGLESYIGEAQYRNLGWLFIVMSTVWFYFTFTEHLTVAAGQQSAEFSVLTSKLWGQFAPSFWMMVLLMSIAFWVMVVPKLVPETASRMWLFQPRAALASGVAAIFVFAIMNSSKLVGQPLIASLTDFRIQLLGWGVLVLLLVGVGLGTSLWLKRRPVTSTIIAAMCVVVGMWLERWNIIMPTLTHPRFLQPWFYQPTLTEISLTVASLALFALLGLLFFKLFPAVSVWEAAEGRVIEAAQAKIHIPMPEPLDPRRIRQLVDFLFSSGPRFWAAVIALLVIIGWGVVMYIRQLTLGLAETGLQRPAYWGVYMVNFIFLIGVSMAGTLISAALHLTGANWRRPITRIAETVTVFGLLIAGLQIMFDMGRPDRLLAVFAYGRLQSPLLWDVISLSTYILASMVALYIPLIPDLAILRDNYPARGPVWRKKLYTRLALGWRGSRGQWFRLERAIRVISIIIIPIGISLHTVTAWILATTVQPGWHSTIMGPYFVVGAIFSGLGLLLILITLVRRIPGLEAYIGAVHYRNLGWLFIVMNAVWFYFTYTEHLTVAAGQQSAEFPALASKLWGQFAPGFWGMVLLMGIALWVMVVPKLVPEEASWMWLFRPRAALGFGAAAIFVFVAIMNSAGRVGQPISALLAKPDGQMLGWGVLVLLLMGVGLGTSLWLKRRPVASAVIAAVGVVVGMWLERWNIIMPTLTHPRFLQPWFYQPTLTEVSLTVASLALFALLCLLFFKLFPVVSIWEVAEGGVIEAAQAKIHVSMPELSGPRRRMRQWGLR